MSEMIRLKADDGFESIVRDHLALEKVPGT